MITIGNLIKDRRLTKKLSRKKLGELTKIRENFIAAIENENWGALPEKAVVSGFIKSIAGALDISLNQATALFRRDFPQTTLKLNPKPDLPTKLVWSPRFTFILGSVVVFLMVGIYLFFQYLNFIQAPKLTVELPIENQIVKESVLKVKGVTDSAAAVIVNNQPVVVADDGNFETELEVTQATTQITIKAKSRVGKETVVVRSITVEIE